MRATGGGTVTVMWRLRASAMCAASASANSPLRRMPGPAGLRGSPDGLAGAAEEVMHGAFADPASGTSNDVAEDGSLYELSFPAVTEGSRVG